MSSTVLVVARTFREFMNQIPERFGDRVKKVSRAGAVILEDGTQIKFIESPKHLRGYHGVQVEIWGLPEWALADLDRFNDEIMCARMP